MDELKIPRHIGFIMDGNGRWAKLKGKPRNYGHLKGADRVEEIVTCCFNMGVECVSLYAFSTENWSRPKNEVDKIFDILEKFLEKYGQTLIKNRIRLKISGDVSAFPEKIRSLVFKRQKETEEFTSKTLNIAINYGGRQEILRAANNLLKSGKTEISEQDFKNELYTAGLPEMDLVVRTSGEMRISNFFLYDVAYAEFYFTDVLWPDFDEKELKKAIECYSHRKRRFGNV